MEFKILTHLLRNLADNTKLVVNKINSVTQVINTSVLNLSEGSKNVLDFVSGKVANDYKQMIEMAQKYEEDTIIFKKKPFYSLSSLFAALLIIVTASITFLVTYYADYNGDNFHGQSEEVDVVKFYEDIYKESDVSLLCKVNTVKKIAISIVYIKHNEQSIVSIYFHGNNKILDEHYNYILKVNDSSFNGVMLQQNDHVEYFLKDLSIYHLDFKVIHDNQDLFYFCTNF